MPLCITELLPISTFFTIEELDLITVSLAIVQFGPITTLAPIETLFPIEESLEITADG